MYILNLKKIVFVITISKNFIDMHKLLNSMCSKMLLSLHKVHFFINFKLLKGYR